eukprot:TRINITY_DN20923_c0_g1_i4.p1 TRINITY_DN20923_c0_g1~~TRINITY_DN20923_c0_g1_i4.p1  ORF type:complete len:247 (-),score=9.58 TRINITY_DN20923_c0_g1_i4:295-990(-)
MPRPQSLLCDGLEASEILPGEFYWCKVAFLLLALYIEYSILDNARRKRGATCFDARGMLCLAFGGLYILRVWTQTTWLSRGVSWVETFAEAGGVITISLAALAYGAARRHGAPISVLDVAAGPVFLLGTWLNIGSEYDRHVWKMHPDNSGHLYTEGLFAMSRHINYFGEVLAFAGFAMASSPWNLWVPVAQGVGLALFSVPELDSYLSSKYAEEWTTYCRDVPWQMIPFVW